MLLTCRSSDFPLPLRQPPASQPNPLVTKFSSFVPLDADDIRALERITACRRTMKANDVLVHEDSKPQKVFLIVEGVAFRYRFLADGHRQIFGYLLPGDLCDAHYVISSECDHNIGLLSNSQVAVISPNDLMEVMVAHPRIERAVLINALVETAMLRESLLNLGQREAYPKLAHFFCEITARLEAIGASDGDGSYSLPLTQIELGDTMGLTVVHVNRMLQRFRQDGILNWSRRRLDILNATKLHAVAGFNPRYLRLDCQPSSPRMAAYG